MDQLYYSITQATGHRSNEEAIVENGSPDFPDEGAAYADRPVESLGEHGVSMQRALVFLNSPYVHEAVQSGARIAVALNGRHIGRTHVEWLFLATLSPPP